MVFLGPPYAGKNPFASAICRQEPFCVRHMPARTLLRPPYAGENPFWSAICRQEFTAEE